MRVLLFTGAGASVELGVPAMRGMVDNLHGYLRREGLSQEIYQRFETIIEDVSFDLEGLIEAIENLERGEVSREKIGMDVDEELLNTVRTMRWETEWFVQQSCERITERAASALWGAMLRRVQGHELCIVTTNYDRSLEIACHHQGVVADDGFEEFTSREFAKWRGIDSASPIKLLKIHGSTDWYQGDSNEVYKLKHPLPIFGDLNVSSRNGEVPRLSSAMILPTKEKIINRPPYPDLVTEFRNTARSREMAVFLGTALRDPDIMDIFVQCAEKMPTYFVNVEDQEFELQSERDIRPIKQSASQFLISTFPKMLDGIEDVGLYRENKKGLGQALTILPWILALNEANERAENICSAIERLADHEISVDIDVIKGLLAHDEAVVRRYALALVPYSIDRELAMNAAKEYALIQEDSAFSQEFELLDKMGGENK